MMQKKQLLDLVKEKIASEINCNPTEIKPEDTFIELGLDSINSLLLLDYLENETGVELNAVHFAEYPTLNEFVDFLLHQDKDS